MWVAVLVLLVICAALMALVVRGLDREKALRERLLDEVHDYGRLRSAFDEAQADVAYLLQVIGYRRSDGRMAVRKPLTDDDLSN